MGGCLHRFAVELYMCKIRARILKLLRAQGIEAIDSLTLSPLSLVMKQVTPQQCPINVIYIRVLQGHCPSYSMSMVLTDSILGAYSIPEIEFSPLNRSKDVALELYFLPKR